MVWQNGIKPASGGLFTRYLEKTVSFVELRNPTGLSMKISRAVAFRALASESPLLM